MMSTSHLSIAPATTFIPCSSDTEHAKTVLVILGGINDCVSLRSDSVRPIKIKCSAPAVANDKAVCLPVPLPFTQSALKLDCEDFLTAPVIIIVFPI